MPTKNPPKRVELKIKKSQQKQKLVQEEDKKCKLSKSEQWLEANSKPKTYKFPREKPEPTRFQKPGPMTVNDWMRFHKWLNKNLPKKKRPRPPTPPAKKRSATQKRLIAARMERINKLSQPKYYRDKYEYPPPPVYPFIPDLGRKTPPEPEKYRPFEPVRLPYWWYHEELEMDFWREMRYPVSCHALKYKITKHMDSLAAPKARPPKQHCKMPEPVVEEIPPRQKMNEKQWKAHLRRLEYLSNPKHKEARVEKVLQKMQPKQPKKTRFNMRVKVIGHD